MISTDTVRDLVLSVHQLSRVQCACAVRQARIGDVYRARTWL